jgi:exopolysaccharide production protein ExoQ
MKSPKPLATNITVNFAKLEVQRKLRERDPYLSNFFGTIYVAVTTIILAYGALFGAGAILVLYAIWLPKIIYKGQLTLRLTRDKCFVLLLPTMAIISVIWSDNRMESLKSSMEYMSLIVCILVISQTTSITSFIRGLVIGSTLALIASLVSDQHGLDPMTGQQDTLVGLFGSKNMIGLFAEIGIILSLISLYIRQHFLKKFVFALLPLGICVLSLVMSKSASSVFTLALTLSMLIAVAFIARLPRSLRLLTFTGFIIFAFVVAAVGTTMDAQDYVLKSFGKDHTLTGRTYLWEQGIESGMEEPVIGHGYAAFWVIGRPKAEQLWQKFGVSSKIGFHFHNLFIETFVELGLVGTILIIYFMCASCWRSIRLTFWYGMSIESCYALSISTMFFTRAMVEVDLIGTFSIGPLLYFSVLPRLKKFVQDKRQQSATALSRTNPQ